MNREQRVWSENEVFPGAIAQGEYADILWFLALANLASQIRLWRQNLGLGILQRADVVTALFLSEPLHLGWLVVINF